MYSLVGLGGLRVFPQHAAIEIEMHSTWRVTTDALITGNYRCLINYGKAICSHTCYRLTRHSNWGTLLGSSRWYVVRISWYRVDTYFRPSRSHRPWFSVFWRWSVSAATISSRTWKCNSRSWTECNRTVSNCGIYFVPFCFTFWSVRSCCFLFDEFLYFWFLLHTDGWI